MPAPAAEAAPVDIATAHKEGAVGGTKMLREFADGRAGRSLRGADRGQAPPVTRASPRGGEDLTKINFARFHFNGVNTRQLGLSTTASPDESASASHSEDPGTPAKVQAAGEAELSRRTQNALATVAAAGAQALGAGAADAGGSAGAANAPALEELSRECVSHVGVGAVGQEFTGMLKGLGKRLDLALGHDDAAGRAIGQGTRQVQLARHRWEAVQRLCAILQEAHDAELGLSLAEAKLQNAREHTIWQEESARLASQHDACLRKAQAQLGAAEQQVYAEVSEHLLQTVSSTVEHWSIASFERQVGLIRAENTAREGHDKDGAQQHITGMVCGGGVVAAPGSPRQGSREGSPTETSLSTSDFGSSPSTNNVYTQDTQPSAGSSAVSRRELPGVSVVDGGVSLAPLQAAPPLRAALQLQSGHSSAPDQSWGRGNEEAGRQRSVGDTPQAGSASPAATDLLPRDALIATAGSPRVAGDMEQRGGLVDSLNSSHRPSGSRMPLPRRPIQSPVRFLF